MTKENLKKINPIRDTTLDAIRLAKTLVRHARFGALAFLDPATGGPGTSRVAVAADVSGAPVLLVSRLSSHTRALMADPRCSILLGEPGKGDPLAHPRISLACRAGFLDRGSPETGRAAARFLRLNPKAKLYAGFSDFSFVRLAPQAASLNGGFGQAYNLTAEEVLSPAVSLHDGAFDEGDVLQRLNGDMAALVETALNMPARKTVSKIKVESIDSEGINVLAASEKHRIWFPDPVTTQDELFAYLLNLRKNA